MPRDNACLEVIFEAAKAIRRFLAGISLEDFKSNEEKYEAPAWIDICAAKAGTFCVIWRGFSAKGKN